MNKARQLAEDATRDGALIRFGALKRGESGEIASWLEKAAEGAEGSGSPAARDAAYWLWILGEHVNRGGDGELLIRHAERIRGAIASIAGAWRVAETHWLWEEEPDVYLSNLAIYYAALRSIGNVYRSELAQQACKEIREATFASFMSGKAFVSRQGSVEVWPDIAAAAVPFGLLSAGDLAMLEAIGRLGGEEADSPEAAGLMAGYYAEFGAIGRARRFRDRAAALAGDEPNAFVSWADDQLAIRAPGFASGSGREPADSAGIRFFHAPVGGESPYRSDNNERSPRLVTVGDRVTVRTFSSPFRADDAVYLEASIEDAEPSRTKMRPIESEDGEPYWEAEIGPIEETVRAAYRFVREEELSDEASEWYAFETLRWTELSRATSLSRTESGVRASFAPLVPGGVSPALLVENSSSGAVSFRLDMKSIPDDRETRETGIRVGAAEISVEGGRLAFALLDSQGRPTASAHGSMAPFEALADRNGNVRKLRINFALAENERLYGMGERFSRMEFRGCELDNYVFNQYKDQGFRTYLPVPVVYSSAGYGLYLGGSLYSVFRFGSTASDLMQIEADIASDRQSAAFWLFGGGPLELVGTFAELAGKPKLPPKWAFGPWMSSNNWDSEREVNEQLERTARHAIPSTVMVLEQWSDESSFYVFNDAGYEERSGGDRFTYDDFMFPEWGRWPDPRGMVERIHGQGIRLLLWQAPVMKFMDGVAHAQRDEDERYMVEQGFAVRQGDGSPYRIPDYEWFRGSLVPDFTNPAASEWWLGKRQYLLDELGIDGFKTDGGECVYGSELRFHDGRGGAEMRNEYPNLYIGAFHAFADRFVEGGAITFSRAGYTGAQATPLHWAGDEKSTFEAFRSTIVAGLSCGMSGIPFWGWDLGGFSGDVPTAELYVRSAAMAAFCPVMQYHAESKGQFNMDRTPWNIAERTGRPEVLGLYKRFADIRMNLLPYIWEQARVSAATGVPLIRAMRLHYPDDERFAELATQYLFGDNLLVAPVTEEGATSAEVHFPEGRWLSLFDPEIEEGGRTKTVAADWTQIPVYLKENAVLPLNLGEARELADDVGNATDRYVRLCFLIHVGEGVTYRFEDESGLLLELSAKREGARIEGRYALTGEGDATLILRGGEGRAATSVAIGGEPLAKVSGAAELSPGSWTTRSEEALIEIGPGTGEFAIELE